MLTELNKLFGTGQGVMLVEHESAGEPTLILMHFLAEFVKQKANIVYISLNQSEEMIRMICGKLAIRIDPKLFHFIPCRDVYSETGDQLDYLEQRILRTTESEKKTVVLIDNAFFIYPIASDHLEPFLFSQRIYQKLAADSLVVLASSNSDSFTGIEDICTAHFKLELVNKGTGQNVTGVLAVEHHSTPFDAIRQQHVYHYLLGERSFKLFLPGATQFLI